MTTNLYYELDSLEHDNGLAVEFGHIMVAWSKAEDMIALASSAIIGIDQNLSLELMLRIPTFESRTKWMQLLLDHWQKNAPQKALATKKILTKLSELSVQRNAWVHGRWCKHQRSNQTKVFDLRKPLGDRGKIVTATALKNHRLAVRRLTDKLIAQFPGFLLYSHEPVPRNG